jgi:hypothetical protein
VAQWHLPYVRNLLFACLAGAVTVATTAGEQPITVTLPAQTPGVLSPAANYEQLLQVRAGSRTRR